MHSTTKKAKLLARARRIRGQVEAIERALSEDAECELVMNQVAAVRGAVAGLMAEIVEGHIRHHLVDESRFPGALNEDGAEQLIQVVRAYLR